MTRGLAETYTKIKKKAQRRQLSLINSSEIAKIFEPNSILKKKYKVIKKIGEGVFGIVLKALDLESNKYVAIKVVRNNP
jgi:serine/threonine protein kinase